MEKDNTLLIIEESDNDQKTQKEDPAARLKLALANKKLKDDFFKENEINQTTEIINDDFENEIDKSIMQMEQTVGLTYESGSEDEPATSNGVSHKREANSYSSSSDSEDEGSVSITNNQLIEAMAQHQVIMPFYERRRLSECIEESESDEEVQATVKSAIKITPVVAPPKQRFTVTKAQEEPVVESPPAKQQPVSILKKTPSPPSNPKILITQSPKKIRYEAAALKDVPAQKNSQTIHFPCTAAAIERANLKSFFSPQGFLNPHLDPRYFDTSLVEVRASQTLTESSKSLNDKGSRQLDDNVWIKRAVDQSSISSDSIDRSRSEIVSFQAFSVGHAAKARLVNLSQPNFMQKSQLNHPFPRFRMAPRAVHPLVDRKAHLPVKYSTKSQRSRTKRLN